MLPVRLIRSLKSAFVPALFATVSMTVAAPTAFADSSGAGQPLILDTQHGISDGHSGTVLQTAPLSHQRIVEAQPIASPTELTPNSSTPLIVAPYIQLPAGGGTPAPHPKPQPRPVSPSQ
ncbi:MAG: hypothetical protein WCA85_07225 [Paraburkholderia sp.]|uniref:hypothetical protein n=1 Tax=Paraburkholderia sp. TaxID=1926495 RepID=UPI003C552C76